MLSDQFSTNLVFNGFGRNVYMQVYMSLFTISINIKQKKTLMKQIIFILMMLLCMSAAHSQQPAHITRIKDGDTFVAEWKHRSYTCRLAAVDAPELSQAYGYESYKALSKLVTGKKILITPHTKDLYGRMLVDVYVDGMRLDSLLIRKGYAWHYATYSHEVLLKQCMQDAILAKAGLWHCGKESVCPPWLFRNYNYRNKQKYCMSCD